MSYLYINNHILKQNTEKKISILSNNITKQGELLSTFNENNRRGSRFKR